jgi:hypothetical protein
MRLKNVTTIVHVCEVDAYQAIFDHGLAPAREICDDFRCTSEERDAHIRRPRPAPVAHGEARLAHNQPLLHPAWQKKLAESLEASDCTLEEYCELLNRRVYFWADFRLADGVVSGKAAGYTNEVTGGRPYDLIRVPFAALKRLAAEQGLAIELTDLNSGSAPHSVTRRGPNTWTPLERHSPDGEVQEVTVLGRVRGLGDVAEVLRVEDGKSKLIWMRGPR